MSTVLDSTSSIHPALPQAVSVQGLQPRRSSWSKAVPLGEHPAPGQVLGASALHHGRAAGRGTRQGQALRRQQPGPGSRQKGCRSPTRKITLSRGCSFWITHFSVHCSPTLPLIIV